MEETFQNEVEPRMGVALMQLANETTIFERLMYKNKNQHRRALYFQRLCQVRRDLRLLQSAHFNKLVRGSGILFSKDPSLDVESLLKDCTELKSRLFGAARLLEQMLEPILRASSLVAGLLGQTFFMPFALTAISCLARFRVLLLQVLQDIVLTFNMVSEWECDKLANYSIFEQIISRAKKKEDRQPSVLIPDHLDCKWDGVKLSLSSKTLPNQQETKKTGEDVLQWFEEDRKRCMYAVYGSVLSDHGEVAEKEYRMPKSQSSITLSSKVDGTSSTNTRPQESALRTPLEQGGTFAHGRENANFLECNRCPDNNALGGSSCNIVEPVQQKNKSKKRVAYISVSMALDAETEEAGIKRREAKQPKKDAMFDMLLGLG